MTIAQQIITIGAVTLGTLCTRFLPFIIFPAGKETPNYIKYLGKVLPAPLRGFWQYTATSPFRSHHTLSDCPNLSQEDLRQGFTSGRKICFSPLRREPYAICCS